MRAAFAGIVALLAGVVAAAPRPAAAQALMIAPTAVVVNDRQRTGALTLINNDDQVVEAELSTAFGYPVTDDAGVMTLRMIEAPGEGDRSAAGWVRTFPQRLALKPGERRTVRLLVTPPAGLPDGEYWSRIVVAARRVSPPSAADTAGIAIGLRVEVRSILPLFYRSGAVATGVRLDSVRTQAVRDSLAVRVRLTRTGSAAFVGSVRAVLRDGRGVRRAEATLPLGVYHALDPRLALATRGLPAGRYELTVAAHTERPDLPAAALVHAPPEPRVVAVTLP